MFQPTNESFIQSSVQATIDRHLGETEEERIIREGQPYHESDLSHWLFGSLHRLGHLLIGWGDRLENVGLPKTAVVHHHHPA